MLNRGTVSVSGIAPSVLSFTWTFGFLSRATTASIELDLRRVTPPRPLLQSSAVAPHKTGEAELMMLKEMMENRGGMRSERAVLIGDGPFSRIWCGGGDLNPHGIAPASTSS